MSPQQLVNARADLCDYLSACTRAIRHIAPGDNQRNASEAYQVFLESAARAQLLVITPDIHALAVNILETTGIMDDWQDWIPDQLLVAFPEPVMDVDPSQRTAPLTAPGSLADLSGAHIKRLPARQASLILMTMSDHGFVTVPVVSCPELRDRREQTMRVVRDRTRDLALAANRLNLPTDLERYYAQFAGITMDNVPVLDGEFTTVLPRGMGMKALSRCRKTTDSFHPEDALPVALVAAAYALAHEPQVAEQTRASVPAPTASAGSRAGDGSGVSVIRLRRTLPVGVSAGKYRPRDHRYVVSGHFRNQAYGPGRKLRRRVWIAPYIAGPEGAPLVVREKVRVI